MVKDPRDLGKMKHVLEDVLRIALPGTICACDDYEEIHDFVCERHEKLREMGFLELRNGIPSKYTIERVVKSVNPIQLKACLDACRDDIKKSLSGKHVIFRWQETPGRESREQGMQRAVYPERLGVGYRESVLPRNVSMTRPTS